MGPEVPSSRSSRCFNYLTETTGLSDAQPQQDAHNAGALIRENPLCLREYEHETEAAEKRC